jgi:hypothetical protein
VPRKKTPSRLSAPVQCILLAAARLGQMPKLGSNERSTALAQVEALSEAWDGRLRQALRVLGCDAQPLMG